MTGLGMGLGVVANRRGGGGAGAHRYWRFYVDESYTGGECQVDYMIFRTTPGGAQAATGGTAFGGGAGSATLGVPSNAFTAANTYRRSAGADWWVGYEFAAPIEIVEVLYRNSTNRSFCVTKGRFQYSDDGTTYTDVWTYFQPYPSTSATYYDEVWPQDLTGAAGYKAYRMVWSATNTVSSLISEFEWLQSGVDYGVAGRSFSTLGSPNNMFDNNTGTFVFGSGTTTGTLATSFAEPILLDGYTLSVTSNANAAPRDFVIEATNDGTTWELLDTQTNQIFTATPQTKSYSL